MICCLTGNKPLSEPMMAYYQCTYASLCPNELSNIQSRVSLKQISSSRVSLKQMSSSRVSLKQMSRSRVNMKQISSSRVSLKQISSSRVSLKQMSRSRVNLKQISRSRVSLKQVSRSRVSLKQISRSKVSLKQILCILIVSDITCCMNLLGHLMVYNQNKNKTCMHKSWDILYIFFRIVHCICHMLHYC